MHGGRTREGGLQRSEARVEVQHESSTLTEKTDTGEDYRVDPYANVEERFLLFMYSIKHPRPSEIAPSQLNTTNRIYRRHN